MDSQSRRAGDPSQNEDQIQKTSRLLLSAAELIMNKNEDDEDFLQIVDSIKCSKYKDCAHCSDGIAAISKTIRSTMIEINEIKERNRERRHRELVELFQNYLSQSDELKSTTNTKIENMNPIPHQLNVSGMNKVLSYQLSITAEDTDVTKPQQLLVSTRKRQVSKSGDQFAETSPKKSVGTLSNLDIEPLTYNADTEIVKAASQKDELVAMREKMLAMQRRKMEDRERKKRKISQLRCK